MSKITIIINDDNNQEIENVTAELHTGVLDMLLLAVNEMLPYNASSTINPDFDSNIGESNDNHQYLDETPQRKLCFLFRKYSKELILWHQSQLAIKNAANLVQQSVDSLDNNTIIS